MRPVHATAAAASVMAAVGVRYDLGAPIGCELLNRGVNDLYGLTTAQGRYVVRLSGHRGRSSIDVAAETAFLVHLDRAGVPVAAAMPAGDAALFSAYDASEGPRMMAVFRYAEGRVPRLDVPDDAFAQGVTLARIHDCADGYRGREEGARLDLDHLLHRPLAAIATLRALSGETRLLLEGLAARLSEAVLGRTALSRTRCHGDCHGLNARIVGTAPATAVFFDFDDGGFGYLAYDLAVHLWAQCSFGRQRYAMWHAFVAGYRSVRAIAPADFEAVPLFVALRHIWLMGKFAERVTEWGTEALPAAWLDREAAFLRDWERDRLAPGLFNR